jgi:hypothetical protein
VAIDEVPTLKAVAHFGLVDYGVKKGEGLDYELDHSGEGDRGFAFTKLRSVACGFKVKSRGQ